MNQGGEENVGLSNQGRIGGNREETIHIGRESQMGESNETIDGYVTGGKGEILSGGDGKTPRRIRINHTKNSSVTFTEGTADGTDGYKVYTAFANVGIKAIYCQGPIERTVNGVTVTRTEAFTAPDGTVYVSSESSLPPKQTFDHEKVHVAHKTNNPAYKSYVSVLCYNADYTSKVYKDLAEKINKKQFNNRYNIEDEKTYPIFMREIVAYVNQFVLSDPEYAEQTFSGMFSDWGAVVEAVDKFNTDMGADFTESANFMPEGENAESDSGENNGNIATFGGIDTETGKHLTKAEQDEISGIAKKLNRTVEFEDFYKSDKFKGKKKIPDGYIDKDGNIHINYYAKRPVYFLFKHEITHYLKRSIMSYQDFMNRVFSSNAFKIWLSEKGYSSIKDLKAEIMDTYSEVEGFDEARCFDEILADFVGERLFGGKNKISEKLINALEPKQKKNFFDVLRDIINYFKNKFSENARIKSEIERIENEFIKVYKQAVEVKADEMAEENYSIAGPKSQTANKSKLYSAMDRVFKGENAETVRKDTGWYKGKDGKWRYYIPDNELNVEGLENLGDGVEFLGNCIQHNKLFEAYPQLKELFIRFDDLPKRKRGTYLSQNKEIVLNHTLRGNTEKIKDTLVHEIQHAIQEIEGFAIGGNKDLGFAIAMNSVYEKVKNSFEFKNLLRNKKFDYLLKVALRQYNARNIEELRSKVYSSLYGEKEARQVTLNRNFDEDLLNLTTPDTSGMVVDVIAETQKFIENFTEMGYTEEEIINFFRGEGNDISGNNRSFEGRNQDFERESERRHGKSHFDLSRDRNDSSDRRFEKQSKSDKRGIQNSIHERSDTGGFVRGIKDYNSQDSEDYSIPSSTIDRKSILTDLANGEITVEEAEKLLGSKKILNPAEIANLGEKDADTTALEHKRKKGESNGRRGDGSIVSPKRADFAALFYFKV